MQGMLRVAGGHSKHAHGIVGGAQQSRTWHCWGGIRWSSIGAVTCVRVMAMVTGCIDLYAEVGVGLGLRQDRTGADARRPYATRKVRVRTLVKSRRHIYASYPTGPQLGVTSGGTTSTAAHTWPP